MSQTNKLIANLYNPHLLSRDDLISSFVIREKEFKDIFNDIKSSTMEHPEQHYIIQGARGTGKTTLLLRIYYEIKNDPELVKWVIPIRFNEEQYHIRTLCRLWEGVIELLESQDEYKGLYSKVEEMQGIDNYDEACFDILSNALKEKKSKVVLFIDNIGDILNKFTETENNRLREILLTSSDIRIIGASSVTLEHTYDYEKPFYDFFKFIFMKELTSSETKMLLLKLSEQYHDDSVKEILVKEPERVEALRRLTGGIPRTMVLLFEIFADDKSGDSFNDLEIILDRVTPLYKHRMDDLSPQQQEIVDVIAMSWDAISTKDIAKKTRMQSKAVSAQLKQLEKNRVIKKIRTSTKNYLYQITERFFNIWYLMRCGRRKDREKVKWLVRFLKEWCSRDELIARAKRHIDAMSKGKFHVKSALYLTEALSRTELPMELQHEMIEKTRDLLSRKNKELLMELSPSDKELFSESVDYFKNKKYDECLQNLKEIKDRDAISFYFALVYHLGLKDIEKAEVYYLKAIDKGEVRALNNLANIYRDQKDYEKAEEYYLKALDNDIEEALFNLAILYRDQKEYEKAEEYYLKAIDKDNVEALFNLAILYRDQKEYEKAEEYYLKAIDKDNVEALFNLAILYSDQKDYKKAEEYYLKAIDKDHDRALNNLAILYRNQKDYKKAEEYCLKAIDKGHVGALNNLAISYMDQKEYEKAKEYYLKAIDKDHEEALFNLAILYSEQKDYKKAEKYYLKAVDTGHVGALFNLANLYTEQKDYKKSEEYYLKAIDEDVVEAFNNLAILYFKQKMKKMKALEYVRKAYHDKNDSISKMNLILISIWNNKIEEAITYLKELLLDVVDIENYEYDFKLSLLLLLAKKQYHVTHNIINDQKLNLKNRYRPIYFALMYFMQDEYPDEYKKMGDELKETVEEIIEEIKQLAVDYK